MFMIMLNSYVQPFMYFFSSSEHGTEENFYRQNTYNGYGLPPLAPRTGPGSGSRIRSRPGSGDSVNNGGVCSTIYGHITISIKFPLI